MGSESFEIEHISAKRMGISYEKWEQILIMLNDAGYVTGIVANQNIEDKYMHIIEPVHPSITLRGMEYLSDNSFMLKAKEALKMVGDII